MSGRAGQNCRVTSSRGQGTVVPTSERLRRAADLRSYRRDRGPRDHKALADESVRAGCGAVVADKRLPMPPVAHWQGLARADPRR